MASSNKQDNHHTLESTLQEEREIHAKIDNLKDEERIAMAVAEHLKNRFIAESREPRDDVTRVTIREMMDAEGGGLEPQGPDRRAEDEALYRSEPAGGAARVGGGRL